jgi:hypothetical protein
MTTQVTKTSHFKFDEEKIMQLELSELKLTALQKKALAVYIEGLTNLGCKFRVTDPDGEVYETQKSPNPEGRIFKNKGIGKYIAPYVDILNVGESAKVPFGEYHVEDVQSNVNARAHRIFGDGDIMTSRNLAEKYVEVMRVK